MEALTRLLLPICRFDPRQPEKYRDSKALRKIFKAAIPTLIIPGNGNGK